ncbi:hypothetical protein Goklo_026001, partial [Gossypium klotzschianum]|nr:hypothetical protein [Gossypium klotzschianum]
TQYLSRFINGDADKQCFKTNVPIVTYEDIKPYIDRIANGETSNILLTQPVHEFHLSTGTSGGLPKLIPVTVGTYNQRAVYYFTLLGSLMNKQFGFGDLEKTGKRLQLLFAKTGSETACGLKATTVLTNIQQPEHVLPTTPRFNTPRRSCFSRLDLCHRCAKSHQVFRTALGRAMLQHKNGSNKRLGQRSGCRNIVTSIVKPNPKLADSIENLCGCKSWEGILRKVWPKAKLVDAITTGVMSQYAETLEFYSGGLPLVSTGYICSEAICGINLEPLSHYVVFWELKAKEGKDNIVELDRTIMTECCSRMEESLDFIYRLYRKENAIAALEMKVLKQGSFEALMDYHVSQGASLSQYKGPTCINPEETKGIWLIFTFGIIPIIKFSCYPTDNNNNLSVLCYVKL